MEQPFGLYIHIPFCANRCNYCGFYSCASLKYTDAYLDALYLELNKWAKLINKPITSIYIGGGTPSVLKSNQIIKLFHSVFSNYNVIKGAEITFEANPESLNIDKIQTLVKSGVNRISLGVQTSDENSLLLLGRKHSNQTVIECCNNLKNNKITNISLDLMLGLPEYSIDKLKKSIDFCLELNPTHISSYILKIEDNSVFGKNPPILPSDEEIENEYLFLIEYLNKHNFIQYEISNFSKPGFKGKHNYNYWMACEYLGVGPSAHSYLDGERFHYTSNLSEFINNPQTIKDGDGGDFEEFIMLALRTNEGLSLLKLKDKFNFEFSTEKISFIKHLNTNGFAIFDGKRLKLTPKGFLVSNKIIADLLY